MRNPLIGPAAVAAWIAGSQPPAVLDARARLDDRSAGAALWRQAHVPGAIHADMDRDLAATPVSGGARHPLPPESVFAQRLRDWGFSPAQPVVVYDDMGGRLAGARAWWMLVWAGHPEVYVLDGGWQAWCEHGHATTDAQPTIAASDWQPCFTPGMIADADDVARGDALLLDARPDERYRGESEPLDARAGHVPGARSLPATALIDAEHRLAATSTLAQVTPGDKPQIAYCGSGVSACLLILACATQGRPLPRLYPGSWSEWSGDPDRPIETGAGCDPHEPPG